MSSARRQTLEARLHHPDHVLGPTSHTAYPDRVGRPPGARDVCMCEMPSRDFERHLFLHAGILIDSSSSTQGF